MGFLDLSKKFLSSPTQLYSFGHSLFFHRAVSQTLDLMAAGGFERADHLGTGNPPEGGVSFSAALAKGVKAKVKDDARGALDRTDH